MKRLISLLSRLRHDLRTLLMTARVALRARPGPDAPPVVVFNASTRIRGHSLNAAFSLLTAWALRLRGVPVVHFVCEAGMTRCVLGSDPDRPDLALPCRTCVRQSRLNTFGAQARFFAFAPDADLDRALAGLDLPGLLAYEHPLADGTRLPLGALILPALRWRLRAHTLTDDAVTRGLAREFVRSAWNVARAFTRLLDDVKPQAALIFNGQFYPEATAAWLCRARGVPVITHEVGIQPLSAFFTRGEATAYPVEIPESFALSPEQDARLDAYLEQRFQGRFSMAGIQFWPEMRGLDETFLKKLAGFELLIPVFTNVIFDTSQPHANTLFEDMFAWLDLVLATARTHPRALFVIRAHPDESRAGKAARESVAGWVAKTGAADLPNIVFVGPDEYISSYELIQRARFVLIYNSTIGLEAAILGAAVLSAGRSRFTRHDTVFFPEGRAAYERELRTFLSAEKIDVPARFAVNARRFLYYQLFRTSLPFDPFLQPTAQRGYVEFKPGALRLLNPERSPAVRTILDGLLAEGDFLLPE